MLKKKLCKKIIAAIMLCVMAVCITGIDRTFAADNGLMPGSMPSECKEAKSGDLTYAIMPDGDLYCWGYNKFGNVGNGSEEEYQCTPVKVLENVKSVIHNEDIHITSAITETGELYCWGYKKYGRVGNGETDGYCQRTPVKILDNVKYVTSDNIMAAITETGDLYWWGNCYYDYYNVNVPGTQRFVPEKILENVKSVYTWAYNIAAITENGELYCWGNNLLGELGLGNEEFMPKYASEPVKLLNGAKSFTFGSTKAAITKKGDLYCWGDNESGQVGNGSTEDYAKIVKVLENVKSVISDTTMKAITETGDLYCWGNNESGEVGNGSEEECQRTPVKILENVKYVIEGSMPNAAVTETGELYCWGYLSGKYQRTPVKVLDNVKFADGNWHTVTAITETGDLYCLGSNIYGEVGNGSDDYQVMPVKILENVKSVSQGKIDHTGFVMTAITETGDLYCWGYNKYGEAGNGSTENQLEPLKVLKNVKSVNPGETMTAITEKGELYCWGYNKYGQVGNGSTESQLEPARIFPPGEPGPEETAEPEETIAPEETTEPEETAEPEETVTPAEPTPANASLGKKFTIGNLRYKVVSVTGKNTVEFTGGKKTAKSIVIPSSVTIEGRDYNVVSVASNACKDYKKLQKLTIGDNVESIGKSAFSGCKKLKKIIFNTEKLTAVRTGSKAFKGVVKNVKIEAPAYKMKEYKKIVTSKR